MTTDAQDAVAGRLRQLLAHRERVHEIETVREQSMFGGLSFMVDEHLAVSVGRDGDLLVSVKQDEHDELIARGAIPAQMKNGRVMGRGWLTVPHRQLGATTELAFWLGVGIESRKAST